MSEFRFSRRINAPVREVYDVFADVERAAEHVSGIKSIVPEDPSKPVGPGYRFACTREMFGKDNTEHLEITKAQPGRVFAMGGESCGSRFDAEYTFQPADGGGTRVDLVMRCKPLTFTAKLMSPLMWLMAGKIKKEIEKDFDDLQAACEGAGPGAAAAPA